LCTKADRDGGDGGRGGDVILAGDRMWILANLFDEADYQSEERPPRQRQEKWRAPQAAK